MKHQHSGTIRIFSQLMRSDTGKVYLEVIVKDSGFGMNEEQLKNAFIPFHKDIYDAHGLHPSNHLGLSICKKICEELGGTITAISVPNMGTTMKFTMDTSPTTPKLHII